MVVGPVQLVLRLLSRDRHSRQESLSLFGGASAIDNFVDHKQHLRVRGAISYSFLIVEVGCWVKQIVIVVDEHLGTIIKERTCLSCVTEKLFTVCVTANYHNLSSREYRWLYCNVLAESLDERKEHDFDEKAWKIRANQRNIKL